METTDINESTSVMDAVRKDFVQRAHLRALQRKLDQGLSQTELMAFFKCSRNKLRQDLKLLRGMQLAEHQREPRPKPTPAISSKASKPLKLKGGQLTSVILAGRIGSIVPPPDDWKIEEIDPSELSAMAPAELIGRLARVSPEMARGHFDFLRMANPAHSINAYFWETEDAHEIGQLAIDAFERELANRNGSANAVYNQILTNIWLRGAFLAELVLDKKGRYPIQIAVPDASTVRFRVVTDPDFGKRWEMVQRQDGEWVNIERETVKWAAFDRFPDTPYGTPLVGPDLFPAVFLLTLLQDARQVVAQQGWPRYDIAIDEEKLIGLLPPDFQEDPEYVKELLDAAVDEVSSAYDRLDPTSAYVHTASIAVNEPKGAMADLPFLSDLVQLLERMNVRALKTMPILFGMTDNTSEANANRQWEIHAASVRALQDLAETSLSGLFTLALQAQGIDAYAVFEFHELRSAEEMREAETLEIKLRNAREIMTLLLETPTQVAVRTLGHELPEGVTDDMVLAALKPVAPGGNSTGDPDETNEFSGETGSGEELDTSGSN